jgi:hypothetical protein
MNYDQLDYNLGFPLQILGSIGIPFRKADFKQLMETGKRALVHHQERINREIGFMVDLECDESWDRARQACKQVSSDESAILKRLWRARRVKSELTQIQHVYNLIQGDPAGRSFFLIRPTYRINSFGSIEVAGVPSLETLPQSLLPVVGKKGFTVIKATYPGIYLRTLAALSSDLNLKEDLREDDIYAACAKRMFGPDLDFTDEYRKLVSTVLEVSVMGGGPQEILGQIQTRMIAYCKNLDDYQSINLEFAEFLHARWRDSYPVAAGCFNDFAKAKFTMTSFFQRSHRHKNLPRSFSYSDQSTDGDREAMSFPIRTTALDLLKLGFLTLWDDYRPGRFKSRVFTVTNDSIYVLAPDEYAADVAEIVKECMSNIHPVFELRVNVQLDPFQKSVGKTTLSEV